MADHGGDEEELSTLDINELRNRGALAGISTAGLRKDELISLLRQRQVGESSAVMRCRSRRV